MVIMLGYGMIGELAFLRRRLSCDRQTDLANFPFLLDCVIGGQMLSAVADNNMSIIVGIIIVAIITWVVTVIGLPIFHIYER
jgi:ABC-type glucose/galactose transport system permease subunit